MKGLWRSQAARAAEQPSATAPSHDSTTTGSADPALERHLRAALIESRQRYKDLVEISSDFAWETRDDGTFAFVSPRGALGYAAAELVDLPVAKFATDLADLPANPFEAREPVEEIELKFRRADGTIAILRSAALPLFDEDGSWRGARGVCRDVTEARARDAALERARRREKLFAEIVAAIRDVVEPANMLAAAAAATQRALRANGCRIFRQVAGRGMALAASAGSGAMADGVEPLFARALAGDDGNVVAVDDVVVALARYRHQVNGAICLWRRGGAWGDEGQALISAVAGQLGIAIEQIVNHEALERLSHTDPLTGLFNRRGFFDQVERRLERLARDRRPAALIYVDLDNFKPVNDRFGHQRGDALLVEVAQLLKRGTRASDLVARLGGDEFALWLEGVEEVDLRARAGLLLDLARELASFSAESAKPLGFSIGVAPYRGGTVEDVAALTARADAAMYAVKHGGKGNYAIAGSAREVEMAP